MIYLLDTNVISDLMAGTGATFARIKKIAKMSGVALHDNDAWIAATALELGAPVVTRDRDFTRIQRLFVEDWSI